MSFARKNSCCILQDGDQMRMGSCLFRGVDRKGCGLGLSPLRFRRVGHGEGTRGRRFWPPVSKAARVVAVVLLRLCFAWMQMGKWIISPTVVARLIVVDIKGGG